MKLKQLETLRKQHSENLKRGEVAKPDFSKAITLAIIGGQPMRLRKLSDIVESARKEIADCACRYGESVKRLPFSEIFDFKTDELAEYQKATKEREAKLKAYNAKAEPIMRRAEMDENYDPLEASEALAEAARKAGLID